MLEGVIAAAITGSIALISIIVSYCATKRTLKENKINILHEIQVQKEINDKTLSVQYITDKRIDWIQELRRLVSEFLSYVIPSSEFILLTSIKYMRSHSKTVSEIAALRNQIILMLNVEEDTNQRIIIDIENMLYTFAELFKCHRGKGDINRKFELDERLAKYARQTIIDTQVCLKFEWIRVKKEAAGESYTKEDQQRDKKTLYKNINAAYKDIITPQFDNL